MENAFKNAYKGKKVFITGHTGFKGSWLSLWLSYLGAEVTGYSLKPPTQPNMFEAIGLEQVIQSKIGDILDPKSLNLAIENCRPDFVFHLAAQPLVRLSYQEPKLTYETNVIGTLNVLEAVRKTPSVKSCVVITTDKCYENKEWPYGYRENDPLGGYDPYSSSKACSELVVSAYRNSFFNSSEFGKAHETALASARAGNVIGGGDWAADRLVPDCIRYLNEARPIELRNPGATRPWQHVMEPIAGYLWLGALLYNKNTLYNEAWNFGPYDESVVSVEKVVREIIRLWGKGEIIINKEKHPHEASLLKLDISKAQSKLGWKPVYSIQNALDKTVKWYMEYFDNKDNIKEFTIRQIEEYTKSARSLNIEWSL